MNFKKYSTCPFSQIHKNKNTLKLIPSENQRKLQKGGQTILTTAKTEIKMKNEKFEDS